MRSIRSSFVWAAILAALLVPSLALGAKSADAARPRRSLRKAAS